MPRVLTRRTNRFWPGPALAVSALLGIVLLSGCGGGGGGSSTTQPPPDTCSGQADTFSTVSGTVTDGNGGAIVGAQVTLDGYAPVTTTQFGTYTIPNVRVTCAQQSVIANIRSSAAVKGVAWSGQNTVEILYKEPETANIHLSLSRTSTQGSITGTVRNSSGRLVAGARVFAADGPYSSTTNGVTTNYFTIFSSFTAYTDANGAYTIPALPPFTNYTVTASFAGQTNSTVSNVAVVAGQATTVPFTLGASISNSAVPVVANFSGFSLTMPTNPTRAAGATLQQQGIDAIRHMILAQRGALNHPLSHQTTLKRHVTRSSPAGSIVENVLLWDYDPTLNNVFGYDILVSETNLTSFASIALLRDPLADRFSDIDPSLTPDTIYNYSVARLDTINFPANGQEGPAANAVAVEPLGPISLSAPSSGSTLSGAPTFSWTSVNRAAHYVVYLYDQFPSYQSDTDPNGIKPIWPADTTNPGNAQVTAPATSLTYPGTVTLIHGHTYYWVVIGQDSLLSAFTISPIQSFVAQ